MSASSSSSSSSSASSDTSNVSTIVTSPGAQKSSPHFLFQKLKSVNLSIPGWQVTPAVMWLGEKFSKPGMEYTMSITFKGSKWAWYGSLAKSPANQEGFTNPIFVQEGWIEESNLPLIGRCGHVCGVSVIHGFLATRKEGGPQVTIGDLNKKGVSHEWAVVSPNVWHFESDVLPDVCFLTDLDSVYPRTSTMFHDPAYPNASQIGKKESVADVGVADVGAADVGDVDLDTHQASPPPPPSQPPQQQPTQTSNIPVPPLVLPVVLPTETQVSNQTTVTNPPSMFNTDDWAPGNPTTRRGSRRRGARSSQTTAPSRRELEQALADLSPSPRQTKQKPVPTNGKVTETRSSKQVEDLVASTEASLQVLEELRRFVISYIDFTSDSLKANLQALSEMKEAEKAPVARAARKEVFLRSINREQLKKAIVKNLEEYTRMTIESLTAACAKDCGVTGFQVGDNGLMRKAASEAGAYSETIPGTEIVYWYINAPVRVRGGFANRARANSTATNNNN